MKILLVLENDETVNLIARYVRPLGFDVIRYYSVLKAIDNLDEVAPHAVIVSARDFPRHWKILVQFIRNGRTKEQCPVVVLKGDNFPLDETSKAIYLKVNTVLPETLVNPLEVAQFQRILTGFISYDEKRKLPRFRHDGRNRFGFVLLSPMDRTIVSGEVKDISASGLSFLPVYPEWVKDFTVNMELSECSLRAGENLFSPVCRLVRLGRIVSFEFLHFPDKEEQDLAAYIESLPLFTEESKKSHSAVF